MEPLGKPETPNPTGWPHSHPASPHALLRILRHLCSCEEWSRDGSQAFSTEGNLGLKTLNPKPFRN